MPCDSVITMSVDLSKCGDPALLREAIESLFGTILEDGRFFVQGRVFQYLSREKRIEGREDMVGKVSDQIKQAYAKKSVYASAKKMGWQVQEIAPNKLRVLRRF